LLRRQDVLAGSNAGELLLVTEEGNKRYIEGVKEVRGKVFTRREM
jgi:hypothetical protein